MNKILMLFREPDAKTLALRELADAERSLLKSQSDVEYSTQMAAYHRSRVTRLQRFVSAA